MLRRRRFTRTTRRKRPTQWVSSTNGYGVNTPALTIGGPPVGIELLGATAAAASFDPPIIQRFTLERIRGEAFWQVEPANFLANDYFVVGAGIVVVTTNVAGTTVLPDPLSQADSGTPWLWIRHWKVFAFGAGATGDNSANQLLEGNYVDVKSKRVIRENQQLVLVWNVTRKKGLSTPAFYVSAWLRSLISRVA